MKHLSTRENGKYKTRNIYSLSLSLSLTPSEYNPLILLSCPAHSISTCRCTDLSQPLRTTLNGTKWHLTLRIFNWIIFTFPGARYYWYNLSEKMLFSAWKVDCNSLKKVHYSITATIRQTATIFYILKRCSALLLLPVCGVGWAVSCEDKLISSHILSWLDCPVYLASMPWQIREITEIKLTTAPFTYLNKITIHLIAVRGKTFQVWNWSPIFSRRYS